MQCMNLQHVLVQVLDAKTDVVAHTCPHYNPSHTVVPNEQIALTLGIALNRNSQPTNAPCQIFHLPLAKTHWSKPSMNVLQIQVCKHIPV